MELNTDHSEIISRAKVCIFSQLMLFLALRACDEQGGAVSLFGLARDAGWPEDRCRVALVSYFGCVVSAMSTWSLILQAQLAKEGLVWVDQAGPEPTYWFPGLFLAERPE